MLKSLKLPVLDPNQSQVRQIANDLLIVMAICLVQIVLMVFVTIYFIQSKQSAAAAYSQLAPLKDYIPVVKRFHQIFDHADQNVEFHRAFAIYLSYTMLQIIFVCVLLAYIGSKIVIRRPPSEGGWQFWILMLMGLYPFFDFFIGSYNLANPASFSNGLAAGDYFTAYFLYCVLIPIGNFLLCLLIYSRFGKAASDLAALKN